MASQTFELYGPKEYSTAEVRELFGRGLHNRRRDRNLPKFVLKPLAGFMNRVLWWPVLSAEDVEREFIDQVVDPEAKTFKDLGIEPADVADYTYHYLVSRSECLWYECS